MPYPRIEPRPVRLAGLRGIVKTVLGRYHTCVLDDAGDVLCWGANNVGQVGDGTLEERLEATPVELLGRVVDIAAGVEHTCAVNDAGQTWCWGNNRDGQLGDGSTEDRPSPVPVVGLPLPGG